MISVIVPVYKVEPYLHQCLDSILNQTYRDLEILLIDDGSPDRCGEICEEHAKKDSRIRVFHTENKGLSAARNLGLREAKGEYIGFVDSDDWLEPDMYEVLLRRLVETGTNISACGVRREYRKTSFQYSVSNSVYTGPEAIRTLICDLSNGVWNKLYEKTCWTDIRFPENHIYEEIATLYKVVLNANTLSCVPAPLYHYRMREGSIVHTPSTNNLMDCWTAFFDRYSYLSALPEFKTDHMIIEKMEKQVACAAAQTSSLMCRIPKKQRDYVFLHTVSVFVRDHFPLLGKKDWCLSLRIGVFFSRYPNDISFTLLYCTFLLYRIMFFWIRIIRNKNIILFSST